MNKHSILFIGLDTHKTFTEVAYIEDVCGAKPQHLGRILSNKSAFKNALGNCNLSTRKQPCISFMKLVPVVIGYIDYSPP